MGETKKQINRYLSQQMDASERQAFEVSMAADPLLQQQVDAELEQMEGDFMSWLSTEVIREDVAAIDRELEREEVGEAKPVRRIIPMMMKYAAAIALLLISTTFLYNYLGSDTRSDLALSTDYYQQYKPDFESATKGEVNSSPTRFAQMKAFLDTDDPAKISEAKVYFAELPTSDGSYPDAQYLQAHANYLLSDYAQASQSFQQFIKTYPTHSQRPFAEFYLALSLLAEEKSSEATTLLNQLASNPQHSYRALATELLQEMK